MAHSATFFTDDSQAINTHIDVVQQSLIDDDDGNDGYEIDNTVKHIEELDAQRIGLQFPDELLHDSVPIYLALKDRLPKKEFYILADTTYGSCCVDEVAAQHVDAQLVVHYGHACLSLTSRIPALYIFGKHSMHIGPCLSAFIALLGTPPPNLILFHSVMYTHKMEDFAHELKSALPHTALHFSPISQTLIYPRSAESPTLTLSNNGQRFVDPSGLETDPADYSILYVGEESLALNNILLTHSQCPVYSIDPKTSTARRESDRSNKLLMRRYATMQRARDADVFGILVGTLGVANYLPLIFHLRALITKAQRKFYTISVGKINPAKLANFPEIECYVLVACPENSIVESKEFSRPIVTPYELYLALQPEPTWTGKLVLDFDRVMTEAVKDKPEKDGDDDEQNEADEDEDKPQFSLITGKYRQKKLFGSAKEERKPDLLEAGEGESSSLVRLNQERGLSSRYRNPIGEYLQSRTYQGLDPRYGQEEPSALEQGRSGIPRGYNTDVDDRPATTTVTEQQDTPGVPASTVSSKEPEPPGPDSQSIDKSTE